MTTAYTSLLGLALPVTGELSGTWGDTVNTAITSLLDSAVAGTTSITTDADITLTTTTGASNQARQAIILWNPASGTTTRNITAPAQSKIYTVINASGGTQSIVIRGAGPTTGVTIVKGESATVAWNGTDFIKISNSGGAGVFTSITNTGLTSGRVVYSTAGGLETDSANLTFNGTTLTAGGLTTTGTTSTGVLSVTGNTTLGDTTADTLVVNALVNANLLFTDNAYDIGAVGATRPRTGYFGTAVTAPSVQASSSASSNTAPVAGGVLLSNSGGSIGYYSAPIEWDISGGGGKARMYTTRLSGSGGRFYLDTMATDATYYNRMLVTETGEWYWYNNNVTTGAEAMKLTGSNLVVGGQIQSNLEDGLVSTAQNAANNGIYLQVRPYSGQSGYLTFTENAIADRWALGIQPGDGNLYFRAGQVTGTSVALLSSTGKLALGTATVYGNAVLTLPSQGASATAVIYGIDTLTANQFRGATGDIYFRSSSSFANNGAQAAIFLAARNYGSSPGTANDLTEKVGLWLTGFYDNSGTPLPIYLGGTGYSNATPTITIDQSNRVSIGGSAPAYTFDVNKSVNSNYVARVINSSGSTSSDNGLLIETSTASGARTLSVQNSGTENFNVVGSGQVTAGAYNASASTQKLNSRGNIKIAGAQNSNVGGLIITRTDSSWNMTNETDLRFYNSTSDTDAPSSNRFEIQSAGDIRLPTTGALAKIGVTTSTTNTRVGGIEFVGYTTGYGSGIQSWIPSGSPGIDYQDLRFYVAAGPSFQYAERASLTPYGVFTISQTRNIGGFAGGLVVNNNTGTASIGSATYPGSSTLDTGISVNQSSAGGTMLFLCSVNTSAGTSTVSAVYMIQFYYDGNNTPTATLISGSNSWTFGKSGSNTLTVVGPAGNASYAWFGNK